MDHLKTVHTRLMGYALINNPRLNKGTAFTEKERDMFALHGLLPPHVGTLDNQVERRRIALAGLESPFAKYSYMRDLQDTNETLFYAFLHRHIEDTLPIVYTPTVGEGCQRFSEIWRKPRGLFLSYPNRHRMDQILASPRYNRVRCIVVSDGERILGLGDQGAGGMGIPIGKMALYTALGGIAPEACLPILLDVGTDNEARLADPIYLGWRHHRIRGAEYDDFVDTFIQAVKARFPHVLLQWEDFAGANAARLLDRYRDQLCTFNDDIQGTAAVATGTLLSAINVTGLPLRDQRIAVVGFGSAGIGIARLLEATLRRAGLSAEEARRRFYALDRNGLLIAGQPDVRPEQAEFARAQEDVAGWATSPSGEIGLLEVMRRARPTVLIGVSGQHGAFNEEAIREMATHTARPVIFPLSNPTSRCEATPQQLYDWSDGLALVGTGTPFPPVTFGGRSFRADQTNNSYIFPGLALGIISVRARHVSAEMIRAAAEALAELAPTRHDKSASLLPSLSESRAISRHVALAVARQAVREGQAQIAEDQIGAEIHRTVWDPVYRPYELEED